jgi:hypothetical protein
MRGVREDDAREAAEHGTGEAFSVASEARRDAAGDLHAEATRKPPAI